MNKVIYKYHLKVQEKQELLLPLGAEILTANTQNEEIYIWALVDVDFVTMQPRMFELFGTGEEIHYDMGIERNYISTCHLGIFVFHIFERIN